MCHVTLCVTIVTVNRREVLAPEVFVLQLNILYAPKHSSVSSIPQKSFRRHFSSEVYVIVVNCGKFVPPSEVGYGALIKHEIGLLSWVEMQPSCHELIPHLEPLRKILDFGLALFLKPDGFCSIPVVLDYSHSHPETVLIILIMPFPPFLGFYFVKVNIITLLNCKQVPL